MSSQHERAIEMIERQIGRAAVSAHPDCDFCEGMIQANVGQGHISTEESVELMQRLVDTVSARRRMLQQQSAANRLAAYEQQYGRAS